MNIKLATLDDAEFLLKNDKHINSDELLFSIKSNRICIAEIDGIKIGWLRYNLFWDSVPFMNLLYFLEDFRKKGYGKKLVLFWEGEMKKLGHDTVLTSTQSDETAQHFYRKLGYTEIGAFSFKHEPLEIIFSKSI